MPISFSKEPPVNGGPYFGQTPVFFINSSLSEASIYYKDYNTGNWVNYINLYPGQSSNTTFASNNIFKIITK